jgi:aminoglycoside phosphotransferase (APT) family kinase protein
MTDDPNDIARLSAIVGALVVAAELCSWGFENHTAIVTLADGRRLVVQRISNRARAGHKINLARVLPDRLAAAGLRMPRLLDASADAEPPYAVREYLPGDPAANLMGTLDGAVVIARAMGALLPRLALVETAGAGLSDEWASPAALARHAERILDRRRPLLGNVASAALEATVAEVAPRFIGRPAVFAHGDFCPVNVLLADDRRPTIDDQRSVRDSSSPVVGGQWSVVGLLDVEFARLADPLFDAAWWGWVVRYHHAERWVYAWPQLLAAAGIPDDEATAARVRVLQRLRCLEMIDECATARNDTALEMWLARLRVTLEWP